MSGEIDISHGGAIVVDPEELRDVAARMVGLGDEFAAAASAARNAHRHIVEVPGLSAQVDTVALWASADAAARMQDLCEEAVRGTRLMADVYEYTELRVAADALALRDRAAAEAMQRRMDALVASDPRIVDMSTMLVAGWEQRRFEGLDGQFVPELVSMLFGLARFTGTNLPFRTVWPGGFTRVHHEVQICPVKTSRPLSSPDSIAVALERIPVTDGAQIAVERYTMPDGEHRFVAYVQGTQAPGAGGPEPWDMQSNIELYTGRMSASYQATLDALAAAGARPGDEVDVVGHSQAGMIAAYLSLESVYDVKVQITAGSPVEPSLRDDQLLVQLRHTDDVVNSLSGGGSAGGSGSPDSFTVTREGDPALGLQDLWVKSHFLDSYIETAQLAEDSGDPRVEALDELWAGLDKAVEIERTEYHAERTG
ncbi:hypothetical protein [Microbacterium sp.]|uniref:hypothetical protein n=1 Tax=Microbacterium sp. TaxID=51671 RepID=UPI0039E43D71